MCSDNCHAALCNFSGSFEPAYARIHRQHLYARPTTNLLGGVVDIIRTIVMRVPAILLAGYLHEDMTL